VTAVAIVFWVAAGLIVYTHAGYPLALYAATRGRGRAAPLKAPEPDVSLIVAAHDEERSILEWVRSTLAFDYPRDKLEVIVVSDGSTDHTVEWAVKAGADVVVEIERGGKIAALNAGVARARGAVLAFADANSRWEPGALRALVARLGDPCVGYVCGQLRLSGGDG
jgi:cellulose synthase/poly-beta-1,6-N-acetylglucosamine synthase-like glycosyltransferase